MKRIAFVIPHLVGAGAEHSTLRLAGGLAERGYTIDMILFQPVIHYPQEFPSDSRLFILGSDSDHKTTAKAHHILNRRLSLHIGKHGRSSLASYARLTMALRGHPLALLGIKALKQTMFVTEYIRSEAPDCIFPSLPSAKTATLLASYLLADCPPIVPIIRNVMENRHREDRTRYRLLLGRSEHIVTVSEGVRRSVYENTGIRREIITTIYNPVVTPELNPDKRKAPDHPWFSDDGPPVILSVGRLAKVKDHSTLVKAFHRLLQIMPARLIILGEGSRRKPLARLVHALNIEDRVSLPGWKENPFAFMARASLFVLSSRWEGLPTVLIEALACGCPCVSTDCPSGPAEILEGGRLGPLVPPGDIAALASAMHRTLEDPPEARKLIERAAFFSIENAVDGYEGLITNILQRRAAPDNPRIPAVRV